MKTKPTALDVKLKKLIQEVLSEEAPQYPKLDNQDAKVALEMVNGLAAGSAYVSNSTNDPELKKFSEEMRTLRISIMKYVEENSNYGWYGKSPHGFKLVNKKGK